MNPPNAQQPVWDAVDRAFEDWLAPADGALTQAIASSAHAGLPEIAVAPAQGRLLEVLARAVGARRILEIGTLAGYSAIWLGRALPAGGELITLEIDPARAQLARENVARAGLHAKVDVVTGPALDSLATLVNSRTLPFDLIFIDADKEKCEPYLQHALALSRAGTLIVVDNVVRRGRLVDGATGDASVDGVRHMMERIRNHPQLAAAGVQTVGAKGYDGLLIALVTRASARPSRPADPLDVLLAHDTWGTRTVLQACASLDDAQWHRRFEMGLGSLHDTLTHIIGAMARWADRIEGPPHPLRPSVEDGTRRSVRELEALLDAAARDLSASAARARQRGLDTELDVTLGGTPYRFTRGAMLVHVTTHGMHHRAQCLNMLRHLNVPGVSDRLPEIDALDWEAQDRARGSA